MATNSPTRSVPRNALTFDGPVFEFADSAPETQPGQPPAPQPIAILARTPQPIDHWYWGRIVHDMSGVKVQGQRIQLDWCHWGDENLGFLDKFAADAAKGLEVSGQIVPFKPDDRAAEILHKGRAGVPYQASIDWSGPGALIEEVGEGVTVEVNGFQFSGPGYVVREWPLTSVAVCPYGADPNTSTQFANRRGGDEQLNVRLFSKDSPIMSTDTKGATAPTAPTADEARKQFAADLNKFTNRFGGEKGSKWFSEGKTFIEALELFAADLEAAGKEKDKKIDELTQKLSSLKLGEVDPVSTDPADGKGEKKKLSDVIKIRK